MGYTAPRKYDVPYDGHVGTVFVQKSVHEQVAVTMTGGATYADGATLQINNKIYELDSGGGVGGGHIAVAFTGAETAAQMAALVVAAIVANDTAVVAKALTGAFASTFVVYWKKASNNVVPTGTGQFVGQIVLDRVGNPGSDVVPGRHGEPYAILPPFPYPHGREVIG